MALPLRLVMLARPKRANLLTFPEAFDNAAWTKRGTCAVTANQIAAPNGEITADLFSGVGAGAVNDCYYTSYSSTAVAPASARTAFSVYIKRVTTTGTMDFQHPANTTYGRLSINLALLSDNWERITEVHPAVTVSTPFVSTALGQIGILFCATAGAPLSFYLWGAKLEVGAQPNRY